MDDEKLPEYVEEALNVFQDASTDKGGFMGPVGFDDAVRKMFLSKVDLRSAIHRFAREREAAALERAAKVCDRVAGGGEMMAIGLPVTHDGGKVYDHGANYCSWEIRAMIHKEPANG